MINELYLNSMIIAQHVLEGNSAKAKSHLKINIFSHNRQMAKFMITSFFRHPDLDKLRTVAIFPLSTVSLWGAYFLCIFRFSLKKPTIILN